MSDFPLPALEAGNPLAFLAAVGCLRATTVALPGRTVRMGWVPLAPPVGASGGTRTPILRTEPDTELREWLDSLHGVLEARRGDPALAWSDTTSTPVGKTREAFLSHPEHDLLCCLTSDLIPGEDEKTADTAFRTMSGAGHQFQLGVIRNLIETTTREQVEAALLSRAWTYDGPIAKRDLRIDPAPNRPYALRWDDPADSASRNRTGGMPGANRLAIEAFSLFPFFVGSPERVASLRAFTTGFGDPSGGLATSFTWPVWTPFVGIDVVRSLVSLRELHVELGDEEYERAKQTLNAMGVATAYRSRRETSGKFRNFTPAAAVF